MVRTTPSHHQHFLFEDVTTLTKIKLAITYSPYVAAIDTTIFLKIVFANNESGDRGWVAASMFCIPLKTRKNAEIYIPPNQKAVKQVEYANAYRHVNRYERKSNHSTRIAPFRALRPITEREDITEDQKTYHRCQQMYK
jgi:hypothetical protein